MIDLKDLPIQVDDNAVVRRFKPGDLHKFHAPTELRWDPAVRGITGIVDGELVAVAGLARGQDARWIAFFDIKDAARPYKVTIYKVAKAIFEEAKRDGIRYIYAQEDTNEPNANRWMRRLGFITDPRSEKLMRWENPGD